MTETHDIRRRDERTEKEAAPMIASTLQASTTFRGDLLRAAGMLGFIVGLCAALAWLAPVEIFAPWPR